jgi:hypothetical protein
MKNKIFAVILGIVFLTGCKSPAQIPTNPTAYSCPSVNTGTWTALETSSTEITGLSMTDNTVTQGTWCYAVTAINNTYNPILQSLPSNILMVNIPAGQNNEPLVWSAGTGGTVAPTGYIVYRIAAIQIGLATPLSLN